MPADGHGRSELSRDIDRASGTPGDAGAFGGRARHAGLLLGIVVFLIAAPLAFHRANSYDGKTMEQVATGLADHANPLVRQVDDQFGLNSPYSSYGIGTSLVMAPLRLVGRAVGGDPVRSMNVADSLLIGATGAVVFETLRRRGVPPGVTLLTTALVVCASPLLAYAVTDFSEPGLALMVALIVLGLDGVSRADRFAAIGVGAAVGGAVLFRADSLVLIAVPASGALIAVSHRRGRDVWRFALGVAPILAIGAWYDAARFGSPLDTGYGGQPFSHPFVQGLYGLLLSPGRGVFVYAPILMFAVAIFPELRGTDRVIASFAFVLLIARAVVYARWWSWWAGDVWGPRFLVPALPAFAPAVAVAVRRWHRSIWIAVVTILAVWMSFLGVWITAHPDRNPYLPPPLDFGTAHEVVRQGTSHAYVSTTDHIMFDWSRFPW